MEPDKILNFNNTFFKRFCSTLFLISIYSFTIFSNSFFSTIIILLTSLILSYEWFKITQISKKNNYIILFLFFVFLNIYISTLTNFFFSIIFSIFFSILIISKLFFINFSYKNIVWLFYGFLYISIPLILFLELKENENGKLIILWLLIIICFTDIFSYLSGNLFKGPKIFPKISPYKTISGTFIGIFIGSICGVIFFFYYLNLDNKFSIIIFSFLISISGLFGDLFISKIKRKFKVKDSGNIIPGHGGLLDRYDSISFGLIALFLIQYFLLI